MNNFTPRDTSYTPHSAFEKYKKDYPFIKLARYDISKKYHQQKSIPYVSYGVRELVLDIFSDDNKTGTTKPGVIMIHGGGWRSDDRDLMYPLAGYLAEHGYIAVPVEYRLSPEASYPAAVDDINSAVTWIREHGQNFGVDTSKIVILGCSAGGQLAGLIGLKYGTYSDTEEKIQKKINAIIDIDGIMDFTSKDARRYEDDSTRAVTSAGAWFGGRYAEKKSCGMRLLQYFM